MKNKKQGFTLIELLVVIAIIGVIAAVATITIINSRTKARDAKRLSDMKALQTAMELLNTEQGSFSLSGGGVNCDSSGDLVSGCNTTSLKNYLPGIAILSDPGGKNACTIASAEVCNYAWQSDPDVQSTTFSVLFYLEKDIENYSAGLNELDHRGIHLNDGI